MAVFMREGQGESEPRQEAKLWTLTLVVSPINSVNQCESLKFSFLINRRRGCDQVLKLPLALYVFRNSRQNQPLKGGACLLNHQ